MNSAAILCIVRRRRRCVAAQSVIITAHNNNHSDSSEHPNTTTATTPPLHTHKKRPLPHATSHHCLLWLPHHSILLSSPLLFVPCSEGNRNMEGAIIPQRTSCIIVLPQTECCVAYGHIINTVPLPHHYFLCDIVVLWARFVGAVGCAPSSSSWHHLGPPFARFPFCFYCAGTQTTKRNDTPATHHDGESNSVHVCPGCRYQRDDGDDGDDDVGGEDVISCCRISRCDGAYC